MPEPEEVKGADVPVDAPVEEPVEDFVVDMPGMPMPPSQPKREEIKDTFDSAFKVAFIGAGQGGGRIAQSFWGLGYKRVVAINTAEQDLATLDLPEDRKLALGGGGAGKNPKAAAKIFNGKKEDVLDLMRKGFGRDVDRVIVCVGAGGGTGGGCAEGLVEMASEFMHAINKEVNVGVIVSLPKRNEGALVQSNALTLLKALTAGSDDGKISPLILVDNERIDDLYPDIPVNKFWNTANGSIASLYHLFNTIAIKESPYTSFDQTDYKTILDSGMIVFGAMPVADWKDETAIAHAVRENLKHNLLSGGVDISTGSTAGAIVVANKDVLDEVPQRYLEHAFEQLGRTLKGGNTVHQGIYRGGQPGLVVYTMIGGLAEPTERLAELKKLSA